MIKRLSALLTLALLAAVPAAAVTVSVDAGLLTSNTGTANPIANGDLVLLIASPTGNFTNTTGSEFVSGDNLILGSSTGSVTGAFAMDNLASGTNGEILTSFTFDLGYGATGTSTFASSSIVTGDKIAIRWYDNFTLAQFEAGQTPTTGFYGTYTATGTTTPDGGQAWILPGSSDTIALNFYTAGDYGGSQPNSAGQALTAVNSEEVAVPEPSTYALLATGLLFLAGVAVRRKRLVTVEK